jgi:hypothetical protein
LTTASNATDFEFNFAIEPYPPTASNTVDFDFNFAIEPKMPAAANTACVDYSFTHHNQLVVPSAADDDFNFAIEPNSTSSATVCGSLQRPKAASEAFHGSSLEFSTNPLQNTNFCT